MCRSLWETGISFMSVSHGQQQKQTQKHETAHAQKTRGLKVTLSCHVRTPEGFHYLPQEGKKIHRTLKQKPKQIDFFLASWHLKAGSLIPAIIAGETLTKTHTHTDVFTCKYRTDAKTQLSGIFASVSVRMFCYRSFVRALY